MTITNGARTLSWLHISDLHFEPTINFDRSSVLDGLCALVQQHRTSGLFVPDLVFVTGDIANRGADKEYERATDFFDKLLTCLALPRNRMFVVPGNHDVDRSQGSFLKRTLASETESDEFFEREDKAPHLGKFRAFREWHESFFKGVHPIDAFSVCAPPTRLDVRGLRVDVLPINTATFCCDDSDHNKLWVGRSWLHRTSSPAPVVTGGEIRDSRSYAAAFAAISCGSGMVSPVSAAIVAARRYSRGSRPLSCALSTNV